MSVLTIGHAAITVSTDGDFTVVTVGAGTTAADWTALDADAKAATAVKVVTQTGYALTSDDMTAICGNWNNASVFTAVRRLDLEDADVASASSTDTNVNDLWKLNRLATLQEVTFPRSAAYIPERCLQGNTTVTKIILPNNDPAGKTTLLTQCFSQMKALKSIVVGSSVSSFGTQAFEGSTGLENVEFEVGVTTIGQGAFQGCTGIRNIVLPESVTSIEAQAFENTNIESIRLPNTLKTIGELAFDACPSLKSITIPPGVERIASRAFQANNSLTDVYVLGTDTKCAADAFEPATTYNSLAASTAEGREGDTVNRTWFRSENTSYPSPTMLHYPAEAKDKYLNKAFGTYPGWTLVDGAGNVWPNPENIKNLVDYFAHPENLSDNQVDYYGWNNFMLATSGVETEVWNETRITDDRWYSMVFPFAMTKAQIEGAFGAGTEVCEFTKVETSDAMVDGNQVTSITLYFDTDVTVTEPHHPYMIHPSVKTTARDASGKLIGNFIAGIDIAEAQASETGAAMVAVNRNGYTFKGSYGVTESTYIPQYAYYLGGGDGTGYTLGFYRMMSADQTRDWGYWTKYTAIVSPDNATAASAKMLNVSFLATDNGTTDIKVAAGAETSGHRRSATHTADRVYTLQGQLVRQGSGSLDGLDRGIYIVNGKKYVVR
jgi:hypothetical protein